MLRTAFGFALVLEAHTPNEANGQRRVMRPYGASLWRRWPEFGLYLAEDGALSHWRGPRDERAWPSRLVRGGAWPWSPADGMGDPWAAIERAVRAAGGPLSVRA